MPSAWRGKEVFFFAEDAQTGGYGWLGVSAPVDASPRFDRPLRVVFWHAVIFVLLLLPGAGAVAWFARRRALTAELALALVLIVSATAAYPLFYLYGWNATAGYCASLLLLAAGAAGLAGSWCRRQPPALPWREISRPLLVCYAASLLYLAVLYLYGGFETPEMVSLNRLLVRLPPDCVLPYWVGDMLAAGQAPRGFLGDWLSSDRPPLQTSLYLLLHPLAGHALGYQILGTVLQAWVFAGLWIALRFAGIGQRAIAWTLFFAVFSGFFLFNGTFVWPKLLPAAFLLIAAGALFFRAKPAGALAGAAAGLAMLGHGGSAFGLLGLGLLSLLRPPPRRWHCWGAAALVGFLYLAPWTLYQKLIDPPGNRLLKWHLAGVVDADPRPLGQTLREAYDAKPPGEIARDRLTNFVMLVHRDETPALTGLRNAIAAGRAYGFAIGLRCGVYHLRELCFFHLVHSPQLALAGILGWFVLWRRRQKDLAALRTTGIMLALVAAISAVWCLLMFVPGSTGNHQGSYFNNACLFIALGLGLAALPRRLLGAIAAAHLAVFALVWVYAFPHSHHTPALLPAWEGPMLGLLLIALVATLGALRWLARTGTGPLPGR